MSATQTFAVIFKTQHGWELLTTCTGQAKAAAEIAKAKQEDSLENARQYAAWPIAEWRAYEAKRDAKERR